MSKKHSNVGLGSTLKFVLLSFLLVMVLSLALPSNSNAAGKMVQQSSADQNNPKIPYKQAKANYKDAIKKAKSQYRFARAEAQAVKDKALSGTVDRGERMEIKRIFGETVKVAKEKLDASLLLLKSQYKGNISK